jgi:hypothetical protein
MVLEVYTPRVDHVEFFWEMHVIAKVSWQNGSWCGFYAHMVLEVYTPCMHHFRIVLGNACLYIGLV